MIKNNIDIIVGRRKASVARVKVSNGKGKVLINNYEPIDYFKRKSLVMMINTQNLFPLERYVLLNQMNFPAASFSTFQLTAIWKKW